MIVVVGALEGVGGHNESDVLLLAVERDVNSCCSVMAIDGEERKDGNGERIDEETGSGE